MVARSGPVLSLLLAPPAWGKTSLLMDLFAKRPGRWVYLAPLRALAGEFYQRVKGLVDTYYLASQSDLAKLVQKGGHPPALVVATPETFGEEGVAWATEVGACFVLDEIHLFYLWGESFRPWLREYLYIVGSSGQNILALTATLSESFLEQCRAEFSWAEYRVHVQDWGNFQWAYPPQCMRYYGPMGGRRLRRSFALGLKRGQTSLLFVQTRREVDYWVDFCQRHHFPALGCVGGEVAHFQKELKSGPRPLAIVCTSVLSHGVNLPSFRAVYLGFAVEEDALWLQMGARGGRRGETFTLHCLNWPGASLAQKSWVWCKSFLADEFEQWVL